MTRRRGRRWKMTVAAMRVFLATLGPMLAANLALSDMAADLIEAMPQTPTSHIVQPEYPDF